uniref:FHA domain-containing protein n=1 Tax=candidate division WOR-3 bacterium TaxID=2052148 RepID=A0A7V3RFY5_UNCW3
MATFLIHKPDEETRVIKLEKALLTLGRLEDNDIVLEDIFVSRRHAEVVRSGDDYIIRDCKSRYGTFVNGERITEKKLNYGDEIQLGNTLITFVDERKLDRVPERRIVIRKFGDVPNIDEYLENMKEMIQRGEKKERLIRLIDDIKSIFREYKEKLIEAERAREIASTLCEAGKVINFIFDLNVLLNLLLDLGMRMIQAKRGFIMLYDTGTGELRLKVSRNMGAEFNIQKSPGISKTIANETFKSAHTIAIEDTTRDDRFKNVGSTTLYHIGSVICVPLITKGKNPIGVIYFDNPSGEKKFYRYDIELIESFASQSAVAIENAQLYEKIKREERITERLQRFFSPDVVKKIINEEKAIKPGGEHCIATILFCDIRGYTSLVERIDTVIALEILNEFLSSMTEEVFLYEGTLDKYIGDCVMAIFGAPVNHPDDPLRAIKCALGMKTKVEDLKKKWQERLKIPDVIGFEIGIGINTGEVIAGNIGSEKRLEYTVVSNAVNIASRLEDIAQPGQILITKDTYELVKEYVKVRTLPPVKLKNISQPVEVYEVLGLI